MTVNPEDIPDMPEDDGVTEIFPVSFKSPGADGDFRPVIMAADEDDPKA